MKTIEEKIKAYENSLELDRNKNSIFLALADSIIEDCPYRLDEKTYLLIPDPKEEIDEIVMEYRLRFAKPIPINLLTKVKDIINKFNCAATELGFTLINNIKDYDGESQLYDLMGRVKTEADLLAEKDIDLKSIKRPLTVTVDEYSKKPFLPAVFKNSTADRGEDKYLIENEEQLKKITEVLNLPESQAMNLKEDFIVQEYIKSFSGINSSLRVYVTSTGDVLSSLLLISADEHAKASTKSLGLDVFNPCEYLSDPDSPYFLNAKSIVSNAAAGGSIIPLNKETHDLSPNEEIIVSFHEIDPLTMSLPESVIEQSKQIGPAWENKKGLVLGLDFIYNSKDNDWYYLEANRNPSVKGYELYMGLNNYLRKDVKALMHLEALTKVVAHHMEKNVEPERKK